MTSTEALRRAAEHMRTATLTEDAPTRDAVAAKADAVHLWGLIGAAGESLAALLALIGGYYAAACLGALWGLSDDLWPLALAELRQRAGHDGAMAAVFGVGAWLLWRRTCRTVAVMVAAIEEGT